MVDNLNGTGTVFLLSQPAPVPYLGPRQTFASLPFGYTQQIGGQPLTGAVTVETGHWTFGVVQYSYRVTITEPVILRAGTSSYVFAGSYVVDNGFSGPIAGDGYGDNLGEGKGFRFYANPAGPRGTPISSDAAQLSAYPVNESVLNPDGHTAVSYTISVFPQGGIRPVHTRRTTRPTVDVNGLAPGTYVAYAVATFQLTGVGGQRLTITSDGVPGSPFTIRATPAAAQTDRPTPVPPTATLIVPRGAATAAVTPGAYAWIKTSHAEDAAAQDLFIATTQHTDNPAHFFWQIGRPLHLLPAVSAHAQDTTLILIDVHRGTEAVLHPLSIHNDWYEVTGTSPACGFVPHRQSAYGTSPFYPGEVDPTSTRPLTIVWVPTTVSGQVPISTIRCAVDQVTAATGSGTMALTYTVQQRLTFEATFGAAAPLGGCAMVVPTPAPAPPTGGDPPAPPPAFATPGLVPATCDAGDVGLRAAKDALEHLRAIDGAALIGPPVLKRQVDAHGHPVLHVELVVQRPLVLTYTLLMRRTLG
jgi:hypothetical protein